MLFKKNVENKNIYLLLAKLDDFILIFTFQLGLLLLNIGRGMNWIGNKPAC